VPWVAVGGCGSPHPDGSARGSWDPSTSRPNEPRVDTDDCGTLGVGNVVTSVYGLGLEVALQPVAKDLEESRCDEENVEQAAPSTVVLVAEDVAQVSTPSAQPAAAVAAVRSGVYRVLTTPCSS
jgi:hypothetical protein